MNMPTLGNAEVDGNLVGADPVIAIRQHPDCGHPFVESAPIFHDSLQLDGELLPKA